MPERTLDLGVLFKGRVDTSFLAAVRSMRGILSDLNTAMSQFSNVAKAQTQQLNQSRAATDMYDRALRSATARSQEFRDALGVGADRLGRNTRDFQLFHKTLKQVDDAQRQVAITAKEFASVAQREYSAATLSSEAFKEIEKNARKTGEAFQQVQGKIQGAALPIDAYRKALSAISTESAGYQSAFRSLVDAHGMGTQEFKRGVRALNEVDNALKATRDRMNQAGQAGQAWYDSQNQTTLMGQKMASTIRTTGGQIRELTGHVNQNTSAFATWRSMFGSALQSMAAWGPASMLVYVFVDAIRAGITAVLQFDQALKDLQAITTATDAEMKSMSGTIKTLATEFMFSVDEISTGMKILGQAGFSASESIDTIRAVTLLATGSLSGMQETADLLTTTIRAYRLEASEAGRVADLMAVAINKSKLDVDKLRVAFSYMAPAAKEAGISLEESAAATMLLADAGLRASTIGTSFRQFLAHLLSPTEKAKMEFSRLGITMDKLNPQFNSLKSILTTLSGVIKDAGTAFDLFQIRAAPAVITLMEAIRDGKGTYDEYLEKVYEVGAAQSMADKQMEGVLNRVKNLGSRFSVLAMTIGEAGLLGAFGLLVDTLSATTSLLTTLLGGLGKYILVMGTATAVTYGFIRALIAVGVLNFIKAIYGVITAKKLWATTTNIVTAALTRLWAAMTLHPLTTVVSLVLGSLAALRAYSVTLAQSAQDLAAQGIEAKKTEDSLISYRNKLTTIDKTSREYSATVKRLAVEHEELKDYVDAVTGAFIDEGAALTYINELIASKHNEALQKQVETIYEQVKAVNFSTDAIAKWWFSTKTTREEQGKLDLYIKGLVPELRKLGITGKTSGEELRNALQNIHPSFSAEKLDFIVDKVQAVIIKMDEADAEAKRKALERAQLYYKGLRERVPDVYREMYADVAGLRAADAADLITKLDEKLQAEKEHLEQGLITVKEYEALKFRAHVETIEKVAEAVKDEGDSYSEVQSKKLSALERYVNAARITYQNETKDIADEYAKRYEEAKGLPDKLEKVVKEHLSRVKKAEATAATEIALIWAWAWQNRAKMTEEGFNTLIQQILEFRKALITEGESGVFGPGEKMGLRGDQPEPDALSKSGIVKSRQEILAAQEADIKNAAAKSGIWSKTWLAELARADESQKAILAELAANFLKEQEKITGTEAQQWAAREDLARKALRTYHDTIKARSKWDEEATQNVEKYEKKKQSTLTQSAAGRDKINEQEKGSLEELDRAHREHIAEMERDWNVPSTTEPGKFKFFPDLTDEKERVNAFTQYRLQKEVELEQLKGEVRQHYRNKEGMKDIAETDKKFELENKYYTMLKGASADFEKEEWDRAKDMVEIDKWEYDAKAYNAQAGHEVIENVAIKAQNLREQRERQFSANLLDIERKLAEEKAKIIDKSISGKQAEGTIEVEEGRLRALKAAATEEDLAKIKLQGAQKTYDLQKQATDAALTQFDRQYDAHKEQIAKYVTDEVNAYEQLLDAQRQYFEAANADKEYYYKIGKVTDEEYFDYLVGLRENRIISEREYTERIITIYGSFGERVALGFERAKASMKSFGETVVDIATEFPDKFASGFTSAFRSFAEGTKTMGEAWQEFSRDMLWWIAEIILKFIIMKTLLGSMGGTTGSSGTGIFGTLLSVISGLFGGGTSFKGSVSGVDASKFALSFHKGGIVGLEGTNARQVLSSAFKDAQRLHSGGVVGLKSGEQAVVANKGEGVFTKEQMKNLAPTTTQQTVVQMTNIVDPRMIDAYMATPSGRRSIVNVIGSEAFTIKRLLRES